MNKKFKLKKYILPFIALSLLSCSQQSTSDIKSDNVKLTSGTSGTITPKVTTGQTFINFKNGDNNLILNIRLSKKDGSNFTGDGAPAFFTKAGSSDNKVSSVSKIESEISVNEEKFKVDIPSDKLENNEHKINMTGLKKGDVVSVDGKAYDDKGAIVGTESIKNKKVEKDVDTVDLNIAVSINISVNTTQSVVVNQTQTGPTINITVPTAAPVDSSECIRPTPDHIVTLSDGTKIQMCPPPELWDAVKYAGCLRPNSKWQVGIPDGRVINICQPNNPQMPGK